ncbi:DUF72 domain-containing protein [uncultured Chitinophaga sp.]|uniref:DUF72 domain-containing protein n=1 Tax=uncultured Chitinophaga sp. TaxID=339340 RepID=UPI0025FDBC7F|nr:DUF72 domain-containing protein [uncultured Chitinophaga sp.]
MAKKQKGRFFSGTSGLVLPVPNKLSYPPAFQDKSRLEYYAHLFNSIEVNSSFYKVPQARTVKKWADMVPANFRFTYKLWRDITHAKGLAFKDEDVARFMSAIDPAGEKKGSLLIQFPPSVTLEKFGVVEHLLGLLGEGHGWDVALEFRHNSWYAAETYELADEYDCSIVLHDIPKSRNNTIKKKTPFMYLRFHGPTGNYRDSYTDEHLQEKALLVKQWLNTGKPAYVYFNNTMGDAVKNLCTLNSFINKTR